MRPEIFISYSSPDRPVAEKITSKLEEARLHCWMAPRDIRPGHNYADEIIEAINEVQSLVVVVSAAANASRHVLNEVATALDSDRAVIPFRIENHTLTGALSYHLNQLHWLDATTPPLEAHVHRLVEIIGKSTESEPMRHGRYPMEKDRDLSETAAQKRKRLSAALVKRRSRLTDAFARLRLTLSSPRRVFLDVVVPLQKATEPICRAYLESFQALRQHLASATSDLEFKAAVDGFYNARNEIAFVRAKILPYYMSDQKVDLSLSNGQLIRLEYLTNAKEDLILFASSIQRFFDLPPSTVHWRGYTSRAGAAVNLLRSLTVSREVEEQRELPPLTERLRKAIEHIDLHIQELEFYWEAHCAAFEKLRIQFG